MRPGDVIGFHDPEPVCPECNGTQKIGVSVYDDDGELFTTCPYCFDLNLLLNPEDWFNRMRGSQ